MYIHKCFNWKAIYLCLKEFVRDECGNPAVSLFNTTLPVPGFTLASSAVRPPRFEALRRLPGSFNAFGGKRLLNADDFVTVGELLD